MDLTIIILFVELRVGGFDRAIFLVCLGTVHHV